MVRNREPSHQRQQHHAKSTDFSGAAFHNVFFDPTKSGNVQILSNSVRFRRKAPILGTSGNELGAYEESIFIDLGLALAQSAKHRPKM